MLTCNPLTARQWFKLREPVNWAVTAILFVPVFVVLMYLVGAFLAGVISIAAAFCLFFFLLQNRAIRIACSNERCGKDIETNTPWICGNKGCRNDHVDQFPFIYKCEVCGYYPKAYECHHCGQLIFFTSDHQKSGYAVCANESFKPRKAKKREKHQDAVVERKEKIELKGLSVQEAELEVQLKKHEDAIKPLSLKVKTPEQELEEFMSKSVGDEEAAEKWRELVNKKYVEGDPEREKRHSLIDDWVRRRLK